MEQWMLENGFSYVISRFLGYVLTLLLGVVLVTVIHKKWSLKIKWLKVVLLVLILPLPFLTYFAFDPIYQGDIFKESRTLNLSNEVTKKMENGLLVVGIPGCKYCMEAPKDLHLLKKRNPDLNILFGIVGVNGEEVLKPYAEQSNGQFVVENLNETHIHKQLQIVQFPSYVLVQNGRAVRAWTSSNFGALAKAEFESLIATN